MVDPQRLAQDARVKKALEELALTNWPVLGATELAEAESNLIAAICAAHLDALAGETEGLDFEAAHKAGVEALTHPDGPTAAERAHLQAQHHALLAAAVEQARREEREAHVSLLGAVMDKAAEARVAQLQARIEELEGKIREWQQARHDLNQWLTAQPYREQFNRELPRHVQAEATLLQVRVSP